MGNLPERIIQRKDAKKFFNYSIVPIHKQIYSPQRRKERRDNLLFLYVEILCVLCVSAVKAVFMDKR
jgi:hypothetical protein